MISGNIMFFDFIFKDVRIHGKLYFLVKTYQVTKGRKSVYLIFLFLHLINFRNGFQAGQISILLLILVKRMYKYLLKVNEYFGKTAFDVNINRRCINWSYDNSSEKEYTDIIDWPYSNDKT